MYLDFNEETPFKVVVIDGKDVKTAITDDMSISLNVVRIAAVDWASTSRVAMRWRIGLMRSRVSRFSGERGT